MTDKKKIFYNTIAENVDEMTNSFDSRRRIETIFDLLLPEDITGLHLLDVGCGTGRFSKQAKERGANVVSLDIGPELLKQTLDKAQVRPVVSDAVKLPFKDGVFDIVLSSDVIEHIVEPGIAVQEMSRVLRVGGTLALTCPNRVWQWLVDFATLLHLRPFQGHENFPGFRELEKIVAESGLTVKQHFGIHPWPFQIRCLWKASQWVDKRFGRSFWGKLMVNQALQANKIKGGANNDV